MESNHDIILFDGVCNLCRGSVALVVRNDPGGRFRFAARQSPAARALLAKCGGGRVDAASGSPESIVLIQNGTCFDRSEAILRIASRLGFPWRLLGLFRLIPRPLRQGVRPGGARPVPVVRTPGLVPDSDPRSSRPFP